MTGGLEKHDFNQLLYRLSSAKMGWRTNSFVAKLSGNGNNTNCNRFFAGSAQCTSLLFKDNDVAHAMNTFVIAHSVDMVAMMAHERNIVERIFLKNNIKRMIFHSHVPLIILPSKVSIEYAEEANESVAVGSA